MLKHLIFRYILPTPLQYRLMGDALIIIGSGITAGAMYFDNKTLQIAVFIGIAGKLLTNFKTPL